MTTTDSHRSWYDGANRDESDPQFSVAEHMSNLFAHRHAASLESSNRDYHRVTVTASRYYHGQLHQHSPYASHGKLIICNSSDKERKQCARETCFNSCNL